MPHDKSPRDEHEAKPGPVKGQAAAKRTARIDALMALPIKKPSQITIFGDDDVEGINPFPEAERPKT